MLGQRGISQNRLLCLWNVIEKSWKNDFVAEVCLKYNLPLVNTSSLKVRDKSRAFPSPLVSVFSSPISSPVPLPFCLFRSSLDLSFRKITASNRHNNFPSPSSAKQQSKSFVFSEKMRIITSPVCQYLSPVLFCVALTNQLSYPNVFPSTQSFFLLSEKVRISEIKYYHHYRLTKRHRTCKRTCHFSWADFYLSNDEKERQKEWEKEEIKHSPDVEKDVFPEAWICRRAFPQRSKWTVPFSLE